MTSQNMPPVDPKGQPYGAGDRAFDDPGMPQEAARRVEPGSDPTPQSEQVAPAVRGARMGDDPVGGHVDDSELSYARYQAEDRSIGEIVSDVMDNASTLIRQELDLAKAEASQTAKRSGKGVGFFVGAGVAGLLALIALTLTLWWALAVTIGSVEEPSLGVSGLIVMVIWAVIAAILAFTGKSQFDKIKGLEKTQETVKKIPNAATGNEEKNR